MDLKKVKEIIEWTSPRSIFEVRSFHGLESFYRKFKNFFCEISAQMMDTLNKRHKYFKWIEVEKSFNILKEKITEQSILVLPDFRKTFQVRCDASGVVIGAVLSQDNRHVVYFIKKMNDAKRKYSTYDK
jgi:hypothetical protein